MFYFVHFKLYLNGTILHSPGFPGGSDGKASACKCGRPGFDRWVGKIPWGRKWQPTLVLLLGKSHGQRSLVGYGPWGRKESVMTERLHFTSLILHLFFCNLYFLFNITSMRFILMNTSSSFIIFFLLFSITLITAF